MADSDKIKKVFSPHIPLDKDSTVPLHIQLADAMTKDIIRNRLEPGTVLPSERKLSDNLNINRNTVHRACEQLIIDGLVTKKTNSYGLFIAEDAKRLYMPSLPAIGIITSVKFSEFISHSSQQGLKYLSGIIDRATEKNYSTFMINLPAPDMTISDTQAWLDDVVSRCCGIISFGERHTLQDTPWNALTECTTIPHIFLSGYSNLQHISSVGGDEKAGIMQAVELLVQHGHSKIGIIGYDHPLHGTAKFINLAHLRQGIMVDCLAQHNITIRPEWVRANGEEDSSIRALVKKMFSQAEVPTALLCHNDKIAMSVIAGLNELGIKVPEAVSVIGFDGIELSATSTPPLTTVKQQRYELGAKAVDLVEQLFLHKQPGKAKDIRVPTTLIVRDSVANKL
jgi:DNA-binding LacI/PurR family transcriptional regulator